MNHRNECLGKAFGAALLLTGSAEKAEAAVLEGIKLIELDETCETLVYRFIKQYSDRPQLTRQISSSGGPRERR
jgi:hypothetical protein